VDKPRLGTLLLASAWMRDVGLDVEDGGLGSRVEQAAREIVERLREVCEPVFPGVPASGADAARASAELAAAGCDAVLLAPLVWCEDQVLRAALSRLDSLPLILATLVPHLRLPDVSRFEDMLAGSGTVGALQASGMLAREGRRYASVCGRIADAGLYRDIGVEARAAATKRRLRGSRIGLLPGRCEAMSVTWVDEVALRSGTGVELVPLEVGRLAAAAQAATSDELARFREGLRKRGIAVRTDEASVEQGARAALAIAALAREEDLAGLALNDLAPEMHAAIGLRPCLPHLGLAESGFVVAMEADVALTVLMRALELFTGLPPFYTEIFTLDLSRDLMLMGHAGWHGMAHRDPDAPVEIVPDVEYRSVDRLAGAALFYPFRPGPVTATNAVWRDGGLRLSAVEGESLGGKHMEDNCHLLCRLGEPVDRFIRRVTERGVSQHWAVVPGRHAADLGRLAAWLDVPFDYAGAQSSR
jgi:L-arabinose isomerase